MKTLTMRDRYAMRRAVRNGRAARLHQSQSTPDFNDDIKVIGGVDNDFGMDGWNGSNRKEKGELKKDLLKATKLQATAVDIAGGGQFFLWRHHVGWMGDSDVFI